MGLAIIANAPNDPREAPSTRASGYELRSALRAFAALAAAYPLTDPIPTRDPGGTLFNRRGWSTFRPALTTVAVTPIK